MNCIGFLFEDLVVSTHNEILISYLVTIFFFCLELLCIVQILNNERAIMHPKKLAKGSSPSSLLSFFMGTIFFLRGFFDGH
jgi:hypothetical protein